MGLIIRTAEQIKQKMKQKKILIYIKTWEEIKEKLYILTHLLFYEEGDIIKRTIRDIMIMIQNLFLRGNDAYRKQKKFERTYAKKCKNVKKYEGNTLFHDANIEKELNNIYEPTVKLKSGGYLVINPTEALVSIDINLVNLLNK